ncbi:hypothetical protein SCHIN_v1c03220 [Spiroplasma chinense]|uniref:Uncharacterized protein n=1 Tax=Spiroplasma chinense TaxID=216932 RepID=A0A5B9Y4B3_9MOLU|nr:hypothetical protein [Spiroplasma chinense]QEH61519.1 hypothetical protein SCHIN_v1c03220 [Spiroplasma chinense]
MKFKSWDHYGQIANEIITNEVFVLLSLFGQDNNYLKAIEKRWFDKRDLNDFRFYIEDAFDEIEVKKKPEVDRDSLSCLLRLMAICDTVVEYESLYDISKSYYDDISPKVVLDLRLYDYAFKQYLEGQSSSFLTECKEFQVNIRYKNVMEEIVYALNKLIESKDFNYIKRKAYEVNDLISEILDLLEDNSNSTSEYFEENEVVLYNFAIYYSTRFYFGLLLREKIITEEERVTNSIIEENKPLIEEDEMRISETKMMNEGSDEAFYKTLKN